MAGIASTPQGEGPWLGTGVLGTVVAVQANYYRVQLDPVSLDPPNGSTTPNSQPYSLGMATSNPQDFDPGAGQFLLCTRRSRLKKLGQQVMVGDRVRIEEPDWQGGRGAIGEVLPRSTVLDRPPMANADQILLVFALAEPTLDPHQLSRFLVKAESTGLQVRLALSKGDLVDRACQDQWCQRLGQWGYDPQVFSLGDPPSLQALHPWLRDRITIICGPSGVGKSSLINALIPRVDLRVGAVSGKLGRGRHTTRHVELFPLDFGGLLADSPGFNQPELDCWPQDLAGYFPEIRQRLAGDRCHFNNCLHLEEPNCGVRGEWERYDHYQTLLQEVQSLHQQREHTRDGEALVKRKDQGSGQVDYEPRLAQKRYRRPSRRSARQSLQSWAGSPLDWVDEEES